MTNVSGDVVPLPLESAVFTCKRAQRTVEEECSELITAVNNEIPGTILSPRLEVNICGIATKKVVRVLTEDYSQEAVYSVASSFRGAGYFTMVATTTVEESAWPMLFVCWDPEVLSLFSGQAKTCTEVHPAGLPSYLALCLGEKGSDFESYTLTFEEVARVAGTHNSYIWDKKCCLAYIAAAALLAWDFRAHHDLSHDDAVVVRFPDKVPDTAIDAAVKTLRQKFYQARVKSDGATHTVVMHYSEDIRQHLYSSEPGFTGLCYPLSDFIRSGGTSAEDLLSHRGYI